MLKFLVGFCGLFYSVFPGFTQEKFYQYTQVPVINGTDTLASAWAGGFNNPQFSDADLNNDGLMDLVVFDRSGGKFTTFLNGGASNTVDYTYASEYEAQFPPDLSFWVLLEDFNCDGIDDLFNGRPGKVDLYMGFYNSQNQLSFQFNQFLVFTGFSGLLNIFVSAGDIPAIDDVNGDGDLDVMTFDYVTGIKIDYYENLSMEMTGTCGDTVLFEHASDCWGKIVEYGFTREVDVDSNCGTLLTGPIGSARTAHAGTTLTLFDEDKDGDQDLIMGNILFPSLNRLINGGDSSFAYITDQDTMFPSHDLSVEIPFFASSFMLDVNNDGFEDMIASTNGPLYSENHTCAWYYRNLATPGNVKFQYRQNDFLVGEMLDLGEGSYPVFHDFNNDSVFDIVVGNYGYYNTLGGHDASLTLLENTGTNNQPEFSVSNSNFANSATLGLNNLTPTFGDLDNDGDLDMLIGEEQGYLHYFQNNPIAGVDNYVLAFPQYFGIDVGQFSTPQLVDVDGDQVLDLLVGERNGNVNYFRNTGNLNFASFPSTPTNANFGNIDTRANGFLTGYSAPFLTTLDTSGTRFVLVGSEIGSPYLYEFNADSLLSGSFNLITDQFSGIDEGGRISPCVQDLDEDGNVEMLLGNYAGGISFFTQDSTLVIQPECAEIENIWADPVTPSSARLNWSSTPHSHHHLIRGRRLGVSVFTYVQIPNGSPDFKDVYGLSDGFSYEWQIIAWCDSAETDSSGWSVMDTFTTDCYGPDSSWADPVTGNAARLNWLPVTGAAGYEISGRRLGVAQWTSLVVSNINSFKDVYGLAANSSYEWTIRSWCDQNGNNRSDWMGLDTFTTSGSQRLVGSQPGSSDEFSGEGLVVFPNPSEGNFSIVFQLPGNAPYSVSIISLSGQSAFRKEALFENKLNITHTGLPTGIYFIKVSDSLKNSVSAKMLVK